MTTNVAALVATKNIEPTETTQYTSVNVRTIIDAFDVYNPTTVAITLTIRIVPAGGTANSSNAMMMRSLAGGETFRGALVGQILESGDFISTLPSGAGLTLRASGRKVTL